jgi:hypothetical protein
MMIPNLNFLLAEVPPYLAVFPSGNSGVYSCFRPFPSRALPGMYVLYSAGIKSLGGLPIVSAGIAIIAQPSHSNLLTFFLVLLESTGLEWRSY